MKERPILFSSPMVRAILDGRKAVTRRVVKHPEYYGCPTGDCPHSTQYECNQAMNDPVVLADCPYVCAGDVLWVRETWQYMDWTEDGQPWIRFRADQGRHLVERVPEEWADRVEDLWAELSKPANLTIDGKASDRRWRSAIHMPRWACRLVLEVVSVRAERVQDIGKDGRKAADVLAEGITREQIQRMQFENVFHPDDLPAMAFGSLWDSINGKGSWAQNPWVWRVEFRRIKP